MEIMEQTFKEKLHEVDLNLNIKTAKLNLLLNLQKEIEEMCPCIDCANEYSYLESNSKLKTCEEFNKIIKKHIENLK